MSRLGNDIVDLHDKDAQDRATSPRFLKRSCTEREIALCKAAEDPHKTLWTFWAMKEAAYKALKKEDEKIPFIPTEYECSSFKSCLFREKKLPIRFFQTADYVHALALSGEEAHFARVSFEVATIEDPLEASQAVRALSMQALEKAGYPGCRIERLKEGGRVLPPQVIWKEEPLNGCEISLSHDGRFVATALLLPLQRV